MVPRALVPALCLFVVSCASSGWHPPTKPSLEAYSVPRWQAIANAYGWRKATIFARIEGPITEAWWCPGVELWHNDIRILSREGDCDPFEPGSSWGSDFSWVWHFERLGVGGHVFEIRLVKAGEVIARREVSLSVYGSTE